MFRNGEQKMRRQFKQSLLPDQPPEKYTPLKPRKANNRKCSVWRKLFMRLIKEAGEEYSDKDLADKCILKESTIQFYKYGRPPGKYVHIPMAKYFAPLIRRHYKEILAEIEDAYAISRRQ
jgi:hypothetical protein